MVYIVDNLLSYSLDLSFVSKSITQIKFFRFAIAAFIYKLLEISLHFEAIISSYLYLLFQMYLKTAIFLFFDQQ
jgi:hypothetical protein